MEEDQKKDTLMSLLLENNEDKIHEFLMRNGKKKSYCPIFINNNKDTYEEDNKNSSSEL